MSGNVSLVSHDLTATFEQGKLAGMSKQNVAVIANRTASSYYSAAGVRCDFIHDGAFSFEGERVHGLRTALTIDGVIAVKPGSIVRDYLFMDGERALIVSTTCAFPVFKEATYIDTWAPLEIYLFDQRRSVALLVETRAIDGEKYTVDLAGKIGTYLFSGNAFKISNGEHAVYITFPESTKVIFHQLPVNIVKNGTKNLVSISPGGCYLAASSASYSGYASHTVFAIDIQTTGTERAPSVAPHIFLETGKPWCHRRDYGIESSPL
jgi:hypothetical protein